MCSSWEAEWRASWKKRGSVVSAAAVDGCGVVNAGDEVMKDPLSSIESDERPRRWKTAKRANGWKVRAWEMALSVSGVSATRCI